MNIFFSLLISLILTQQIVAVELDIMKMRDPKTIIDKVNKGFDVNAVRSSDGYTLLHYAAEIGNVELVDFLIKKGSNKNPILKNGDTPLALSIGFDKKNVIRSLLEAGVDPNYKLGSMNSMRSHFHYYIVKARKIDKSIFDLFVKKGADLEVMDFYTDTPLISASELEYSRNENAKLLVGAGANIQAGNKFGKTPLMNAVFSQNLELIQFFLNSGAPVDQQDKSGNSALIAMINVGAGVDSDKRKPQIIKILLDSGANINLTNNEGNTALHEATVGGRVSTLNFLLEQNPDVTVQNLKKKTALDQAIINEDWQIVKILLTADKDLDRLDSYGSTMLHSAILNEKIELIKLLLASGANKDAKDKWGKTCSEFAKSLGNPRIMAFFED